MVLPWMEVGWQSGWRGRLELVLYPRNHQDYAKRFDPLLKKASLVLLLPSRKGYWWTYPSPAGDCVTAMARALLSGGIGVAKFCLLRTKSDGLLRLSEGLSMFPSRAVPCIVDDPNGFSLPRVLERCFDSIDPLELRPLFKPVIPVLAEKVENMSFGSGGSPT